MSIYQKCRVCGGPVSAEIAKLAERWFRQPTCSNECNRREIIQRHACCDKADFNPCVCTYSFKCPEHGIMHIGTHD